MGEVHSKYRITVLMPVYNCEDTLTEAIESLLSQTFDKFKIIIEKLQKKTTQEQERVGK